MTELHCTKYARKRILSGPYIPLYKWNTGKYGLFPFFCVSYDILVLTAKICNGKEPVRIKLRQSVYSNQNNKRSKRLNFVFMISVLPMLFPCKGKQKGGKYLFLYKLYIKI